MGRSGGEFTVGFLAKPEVADALRGIDAYFDQQEIDGREPLISLDASATGETAVRMRRLGGMVYDIHRSVSPRLQPSSKRWVLHTPPMGEDNRQIWVLSGIEPNNETGRLPVDLTPDHIAALEPRWHHVLREVRYSDFYPPEEIVEVSRQHLAVADALLSLCSSIERQADPRPVPVAALPTRDQALALLLWNMPNTQGRPKEHGIRHAFRTNANGSEAIRETTVALERDDTGLNVELHAFSTGVSGAAWDRPQFDVTARMQMDDDGLVLRGSQWHQNPMHRRPLNILGATNLFESLWRMTDDAIAAVCLGQDGDTVDRHYSNFANPRSEYHKRLLTFHWLEDAGVLEHFAETALKLSYAERS